MINLPLLCSGLLLIALARADDWPQWGRTNERNMYSPETGLPSSFDPGKFKLGTEEVDLATTKNVKWVAKLGSQSYGNVTVAGGRVCVGTNNDAPRDPQHQGDRGVLMCFDEKSGGFLWQLVVPKLASGKVNDTMVAILDGQVSKLQVKEISGAPGQDFLVARLVPMICVKG